VFSRYARALRKLISLGPGAWFALLEAQWALLVAQALVMTRPHGRLTSPHAARSSAPPSGEVARVDEARQVARWLNRAADYGVFRPLCLVRSVALCRLLEARGIRGGVIRVGVRVAGGGFAAHAWVEYDGQVLGDAEAHVATFAELSSLQVLHRQ
jgi:hypothetical protein